MKQPKTTKNPRGAGAPVKCKCNTWGCIRCMTRFIWAYYKVRRIRKRELVREARKEFSEQEQLSKERYDWDRT